MRIMPKTAYAAAAIIGAAALTATVTTSARANSLDYGYGYGNSFIHAHTAAFLDLESTWFGCTNLKLVSDTYEGNGSWYAVESGFCGGPK